MLSITDIMAVEFHISLIDVLLRLPFFFVGIIISSNIIEYIDIADSPVKTREESPSKELGSLSNSEEYSDNGDGNNEHDDTDNNDDDDANRDVRNECTEQDPHHLAPFLVNSNEIDCDSGSDMSTDLIHPLESSR